MSAIFGPYDPAHKFYGAGLDDRCSNCGDELRYPYTAWQTWQGLVATLYFCAECCAEIGGGLCRDMEHTAELREQDRVTAALRLRPGVVGHG